MSWSPELYIGELRPWPDTVHVVRGKTDEIRRYVPERTCTPHGEWGRLSQMQEVRQMFCDCGHWLGTDRRDSFFGTRLFAMPKYCPECGRKLVSRGKVTDE